jgi:beta-phosphoglucomutase family hydrolase
MAAGNRDDGNSKAAVRRDRFDAVLFDLDGVLTSTAAIHAAAWKRMFDDFLNRLAARNDPGLTPQQLRPFDIRDDYRRYIDGKPRYDGVRSFLQSRGIGLPEGHPDDPPGDQTVCALGNRKDAMVKEAIDAGRVESFPGSVKWARQLKEQGFKLAVVSSSRNCAQVLRAAGIDHLFSARVDGQTLIDLNLPGKPAPDSFLKAAELLGTTPDRAVVVEDAISGVESGRAGGFALIIGVDREGHADALRQHGAHIIVEDLSELVPPGS